MIERLNHLINYLTESDIDKQNVKKNSFDLIILAGNSLPSLARHSAYLMDQKVAPKLLITGGYGHGTKRLFTNIEQESILKKSEYQNSDSEALLLKKIFDKHREFVTGEVSLEEKSRNTGENAEFTYKKIIESGIKAEKILLLQDPILLRRTKLTFKQQFNSGQYRIFSYSPFIIYLSELNGEISFIDSKLNNLWEKEYFISLVLGEIRRLHDSEDGYGPKGKGFIPHVELPERILEDYYYLKEKLYYYR